MAGRPVDLWALGVIIFVILGGGDSTILDLCVLNCTLGHVMSRSTTAPAPSNYSGTSSSSGYPPFDDETKHREKVIIYKIKTAHYEFHSAFWGHVSDEAKDLIRGLLTVNPLDRLTVDQALASPWVSLASYAYIFCLRDIF